MKGVVAAGSGVAAAAYVKPSLRALGIPGALAQVSGAAQSTPPADSSTTGDNDPSVPVDSSLPGLPSTGAGGMADASAATSSVMAPVMLGVALAGGLAGRRMVRSLRDDREPAGIEVVADL